MNLINIENEPIPKSFFVFVNLRNNLTRRNFEETGCICSSAFLQLVNETDKSILDKYLKNVIMSFSPSSGTTSNFKEKYINGEIDYLPFSFNPNNNLNFVSFFHKSIVSDYGVEYSAEITRKAYFSKFPSRLSSCYAFGNYESCIEANRKYGWDLSTVREFEIIENEYNRVAKVNMEIVSLARSADRISSLDEITQKQIWSSYWKGFGDLQMELPTFNDERQIFNSGVLWEYLIEGILKSK
jgi:hypothetical protein